MAEYKAFTEPFQNKGLVSKLDPAALQPGQFQDLVNMNSLQEGSLTICRGTQRINGGDGSYVGLMHTIQKLRKSADQAANYRYLGVDKYIYRGAASDAGPFTQIINLGDASDQVRWTSIDYATGVSGNPSKYIATNSFAIPSSGVKRSGMLKDNGLMTPPQFWGILPPVRPVTAVQTTPGLLDIDVDGVSATWNVGQKFPEGIVGQTIIIDGVENSVAIFTDNEHLTLSTAATPGSNLAYSIVPNGVVANFDWLYTFRNDVTGLEGNPCVPMGTGLADDGSFYTLTFGGTDDPQIAYAGGFGTAHHSIAIYRRGGIFADGLYRFIGYAQNSSSFFLNTTFLDNVSDDSLVNARILEFDNDAPVTSNLPVPLSATINSSTASITGGAYYVITLNALQTPAGGAALEDFLRAGSQITVGSGDNAEDTLIAALGTGNLVFVAWLQNAHSNGESVTCSNVVNAPCQFTCLAFNSAFWAGDANNPHVLYKSKTARVESAPIVNLENGASGSIVVGSPSNPIMNITEFNGQVVVMNLSTINLVNVWNGAMQAPLETPSKRGLLASFAWCKVGNAIWYLSYDGVYSWEGGQEQKRSEAINPIFLGETVNGIPPMDMNAGNGLPTDPNNALRYVNFEYHNHEVNIVYRDIGGQTRRLRYSIIYDRWYLRDDGPGIGEINPITGQPSLVAVNAMHLDEDTGTLVLGKFINTSGRTFLEYDDLGSSNSWYWNGLGQPNPAAGTAISFTAYGAFYNLGTPAANKHWGDLVLELDNIDCISLQVELFWDFSTVSNAWDRYSIPSGINIEDAITSPPGHGIARRTVSIPILDKDNLTTGRDARAMAVKITGSSVHPLSLYSLTFHSLPLEFQQRGRASDWDWLDYDYDKLLQEITFEYDLSQAGGGPRTLVMDTKSGINGTTETLAVQSFTLAGNRTKANFPIRHDVVAKMVRLRMVFDGDQSQNFMFWQYKFQFDKWPADNGGGVTFATPWEPNGPDYDKYYQQLDLDVDTGGVGATVIVQIDGGSAQTLPLFATTSGSRHINFTLGPNLKGKQARLLITSGPNGKFQLFEHKFITLPADRGQVLQTFDWDFLGHPFEKRLKTITLEYDTGGVSTTMQMDTLSGNDGNTLTQAVQLFVLNGTGRSKQTYAFPDGVIAVMIRIFPVADTTTLKHWAYTVDKIDYPAPIVRFLDFDNLGYPCQKLLRELTLEMNTGGVPCEVQLELDGTVQHTFSITTTANDKTRMVTLPSRPNELRPLLARLLFNPGQGGRAQYFASNFNRTLLPCRVTHWSSFEVNWGGAGQKFCKQCWIDYQCEGSILVSFYVENRTLFYQKILPSHVGRDTERFYLPAIFNGVLNQSKEYAIDIDSLDTNAGFYLYKDSSRCEIRELAADQRAGYLQRYVYFDIPISK